MMTTPLQRREPAMRHSTRSQTRPSAFNAVLAAALSCALLALAATASHAAGKPKEASFGKGKASGAFLTREQLRGCIAQQARLAQQDGELQQDQAALASTKAELARSGDELKTQLDALDRSSAEAVSAYNERAAARDKSIDDYEARVPRFNERVEAVKTEREAFGKGCNNRRYFEDDEIAIRKGK
jgi:hypothetical protein